MLTFLRKRTAVVGFVILTAAVVFAISLAFTAIHENRVRDNATRCSVVHLVIKLSESTRRAANATVASPSATAAQKAAAVKNLSSIQAALRTTTEALGNPTGVACHPT